ncbi:hypothetical protein FNF29_03143 [Cafeteria roenbergensis]|uniref:YEATS domain-containing protein n=1 Tax=Cafeteria roenbergensis TaxID=33653 RepID=A0A5A8E0E8_CAFRO|nr:hypothetical protein FNF29_03143 [Cafeteria roenbergensis]KAA0170939.1 hypothetical protein FNF28_01217 [Cafeteria roenbergensis]|eukprot:KAA0153330.1 hypothetical protein FNF29_03143 [Cafeteria roenbergensis]
MAENVASSSMERQHALLASQATKGLAETEELAEAALKEVMALMEDEAHAGAHAPYCPIVYGSIAFKLKPVARKADEAPPVITPATHRWTLFVRGVDGSDISHAIKSVEFKLHETFPEPLRVVTEPPFEVSDEGWGEFEAQITVRFHDDGMLPVRIAHHLRLHPQPGQASTHPPDAPVVHEFYDEVVFNHPERLPDHVAAALRAGPATKAAPHRYAHHFKAEGHTPEADLAQLAAAQAFVAQETARLTERLARADAEAVSLTKDLEALGWSTAKCTRSTMAPTSSDASAGASRR